MRLSVIKVLAAGCLTVSSIGFLLAASAGCSSAEQPAASAPAMEQPASDESTLAIPVADLNLPAPSELKAAREVFSDVFHLGADYETSWPHERGNKTDDDQLRLAPWYSYGRAHISYYEALAGFVKYAQMPSS